MTGVSSLGMMTQSILQIQNVQGQLSDLSNQLSTGKKSIDLTDYSLTDSSHILDFRGLISKKQSFIDSINTVEPQLKIYDTTFNSLDTLANDAIALVNQATGPAQAQLTAAGSQFQGMMDQIGYYLNQKLGDRFLFGGARFGVKPVGDITALPVPPVENTTVASPTLPTYDSAAPGSDATAYTKETLKIDDGFTVTYGVCSDDPAFQKLVLGVRWAYAASQESDPTTFDSDMTTARGLINGAISDMRTLHGQVVNNIGQLDTTKALHTSFISSANGQIDDIQTADPAEVTTKITFAQASLQASYSVTGKIASLSLVNFI